jgi:PemK-like, MazF-like toxin of type II toxin-antitoxin system
MAIEKPVRGEVWDVDLKPVLGHEQGRIRPALIVSVDQFNQGPSGLVIVVPMTTEEGRILPARSPGDLTFKRELARHLIWENQVDLKIGPASQTCRGSHGKCLISSAMHSDVAVRTDSLSCFSRVSWSTP